jgi:hypothetical protein
MAKLGITIRINAANDTLTTADGTVFDRSTMTKPEKRKLSRIVRDIYKVHTERN